MWVGIGLRYCRPVYIPITLSSSCRGGWVGTLNWVHIYLYYTPCYYDIFLTVSFSVSPSPSPHLTSAVVCQYVKLIRFDPDYGMTGSYKIYLKQANSDSKADTYDTQLWHTTLVSCVSLMWWWWVLSFGNKFCLNNLRRLRNIQKFAES